MTNFATNTAYAEPIEMAHSANQDADGANNKNTEVIGLWVRAPKTLLYHTDLTDGAKLLYLILRDYQGRNEYAFPSVDTLARDTGKSIRRVQQLIKELEAAEAIEVVTQRGWVSLYHTCYPEAKKEDVEAAEKAGAEKEQTNENSNRNSCQPTRPRKVVLVPPKPIAPVPPKPVAPELDEFKLDSNTNVCKGTVNLAENEQLRSGNQNSQYQQPPSFKVIDSQKSSYQKVSPLVKEVLSAEQQEIADMLHGAGVATEDAERIALTNRAKSDVQAWINYAKGKTNPGGYLVVVFKKGDAGLPKEHHSKNQSRGNNGKFYRKGDDSADEAVSFTTDTPIDFSKYAPGGKYGHFSTQTDPVQVTQAESVVADVVASESMETHDTNSNAVIDVQGSHQPCENLADDYQSEADGYENNPNVEIPGFIGYMTTLAAIVPNRIHQNVAGNSAELANSSYGNTGSAAPTAIKPLIAFNAEQSRLLQVIGYFAPQAVERVVDVCVVPLRADGEKLIVTLTGDVSQYVEEYWVRQFGSYRATNKIQQVEFKAAPFSPIEQQTDNSESVALPVVENELAQSAIGEYQLDYEQAETVAVAATPVTDPSSPASLNANSDSRLAKALQLLEADTAFVSDANIENNSRGEPTLTVIFRADQKPTARSLEAWKQAVLRFNPFTRIIKHIVVKDLQPEPERSEVVGVGGYFCNFQPIATATKEPCEQAAPLANTKNDCEAWKTPAISKCLELLGDDAELVRDIRIGPNWIGQLAIIAVFDADRQLSREKLVAWRTQILKGHNKELRGKNIKEVEVELLKPSSPAQNDAEKLDSCVVEAIEVANNSGDVEVADNCQPRTNANSISLTEVAAIFASDYVPEVAATVVEAEPETNDAVVSLSEVEDVAQCETVTSKAEKTELSTCTPVSANSSRKPSAQLLAMLEQQAERRRELAAKFNFNRPHIAIHNDWQMLKQANQWWRQTYKRCYGKDAPKDEIELRIDVWLSKFLLS